MAATRAPARVGTQERRWLRGSSCRSHCAAEPARRRCVPRSDAAPARSAYRRLRILLPPVTGMSQTTSVVIRSAALAAALLSLLAACTLPSEAPSGATEASAPAMQHEDTAVEVLGEVRVTRHEGDDDLLSGGLGLAGLRAMMPPAAANPLAPTAAELRRMAMHANWRGIADLSPGGGVEALFPELPQVTGEEHHALLRLSGRNAPHRVVLQLPDNFDPANACIVVAPASGSRGVYGAIAVAGPWALPRGCALVLTDKGAGTDVFHPASATGTALDGSRATLEQGEPLAFVPPGFTGAEPGELRLALRHLHSQDNPEADWGLHAEQAARFALERLRETFGSQLAAQPRVLAVGISNGGGAVLKAAERDSGVFDAVVAGEPNISVAGARSLFDYATEAALLQPCALLDPRLAGTPFNGDVLALAATARCASLHAAGLVEGDTPAAQAASAYDALLASGWSEAALEEAALNAAFDLWRAIAAGYASAYARAPWDAMPCGYGYAVVTPDGTPMPAPPLGLALWWSMGSGIPPMMGIGLLDEMAAQSPADPAYAGLSCLRALASGEAATARAVQQGVAAVQASAAPRVPTIVLHGAGDGLIPPVFSSRPYVAAAQSAGAELRYWEIENAQHFDAFLAVPDMGARYVPLLPYVYRALDRVSAHLDGEGALPADAVIKTTSRGAGRALEAAHLAMP